MSLGRGGNFKFLHETCVDDKLLVANLFVAFTIFPSIFIIHFVPCMLKSRLTRIRISHDVIAIEVFLAARSAIRNCIKTNWLIATLLSALESNENLLFYSHNRATFSRSTHHDNSVGRHPVLYLAHEPLLAWAQLLLGLPILPLPRPPVGFIRYEGEIRVDVELSDQRQV